MCTTGIPLRTTHGAKPKWRATNIINFATFRVFSRRVSHAIYMYTCAGGRVGKREAETPEALAPEGGALGAVDVDRDFLLVRLPEHHL